MRVLISIVSAACVIPTLAGCAFLNSPVPPGRPVRTVYEEGGDGAPRPLRIEQAPPPGAFRKTRPVIYPPKIFAVHVPEHLVEDRDMKIGAHWVYVKLRDSSWKQEAIDREPFCQGTSTADEVTALRVRMRKGAFGRMLIPFDKQRGERLIEASATTGGGLRGRYPGPPEVGDER